MNEFNYKIKPIALDDIVHHDKAKYNSNNHWVNGSRPANYDLVLSQTDTANWFHLFKPNTRQIKITNQTWIQWLKKANEISSQTGKFTALYEDEINIISNELDNLYPDIFNHNENNNQNQTINKIGYFIRVNNVSLKYGEHKEGPYYSFRQILESVVSCIQTHTPLKDNTSELIIYFFDWIDIDPKYEFRVFVHNNKITAISQQNIYSKLFEEYTVDAKRFEQDIKPILNKQKARIDGLGFEIFL